jgi:hypothetical protein
MDMKTGLKIVLVTFALTAFAAQAQTYSIDWYKIAGGSGTSTGGTFAVSGTIGQHDAGGPMTGGNYSLTGGFWAIIAAVQMPGAPLLTITITGPGTVVVSWPYPSTGLSLQQNGDLNTANWTSGPSPVHVGDKWQVTVSPPVGNRFYRLMP